MGITTFHRDIDFTKQTIIKDCNFKNTNLESCVVNTHTYGKEFWILRKINNNGEEFYTADVYIISTKNGETSYKDINIEMGVYYYHIPKSWLSMIKDVPTAYLERYELFHNKKTIEPGMEFELKGLKYKVEYKYSSHSWVIRSEKGNVYRMKSTSIQEKLR